MRRLSAIATVDLSDEDVFPAGTDLVLIWTPTGTGGPVTDTATISTYQQTELAGLSEELQDVYPRVYDGLTKPKDRLRRVSSRAKGDISKLLMTMDTRFDISKIRDQSLIVPAVAAQCAVLWSMNGDDDIKDERAAYRLQVQTEVEILSKLNIWVDQDGDLVDDPGESRVHPHIFRKGW